jgi:hypothetical protein
MIRWLRMNGATIHNICNRLQVLLVACVALLVVHLATARRETVFVEELLATATITEIMLDWVAPSSARLFQAVEIVVDSRGEQVRAPDTDDEWALLRADAIVLMEAANLLRLEGRRVSHQPGHAPVATIPTLPVRQLQRMIDLDREGWRRRVDGLGNAARWAYDAIAERNVWQLQANAGDIALACERCHLDYRYRGAATSAVPD